MDFVPITLHVQVPKCRTGETEDRLDLWNAPNEGKVKMDPGECTFHLI